MAKLIVLAVVVYVMVVVHAIIGAARQPFVVVVVVGAMVVFVVHGGVVSGATGRMMASQMTLHLCCRLSLLLVLLRLFVDVLRLTGVAVMLATYCRVLAARSAGYGRQLTGVIVHSHRHGRQWDLRIAR